MGSSRIHIFDRVGRDAFPASISFFLLATPHGPILFGQIEPGTPPFDAIGRALDPLCPGLHDPRAHPHELPQFIQQRVLDLCGWWEALSRGYGYPVRVRGRSGANRRE